MKTCDVLMKLSPYFRFIIVRYFKPT